MGAEDDGFGNSQWLESFFFQQRHGRLNVREIARLDLEKLVSTVDVGALQNVLENVAFCRLSAGDLAGLSDDVIVKAYRVAQLIIEYLLNLENELFAQGQVLVKENERLQLESDQFCSDNRLLADENDAIRRDLKAKRRALATFEYLLTAHGPEALKQYAAAGVRVSDGVSVEQANPVSKSGNGIQACVCLTCAKAFSSREFLRKHCMRRKHDMPAEARNSSSSNDENASPNVLAALKEQQETLLEKVSKSLELRHREELEQVRESEHRLYQDQLDSLREDRRASEARIEMHFKTQLLDQRNEYEKRIAALESKLDVYSSNAHSWTTTTTDKQTDENSRLERIERELAANQLMIRQQQLPQSSSSIEDSVEVLLAAQKQLNSPSAQETANALLAQEQAMQDLKKKNFIRVLASIQNAHSTVATGKALSRWKVFTSEKGLNDALLVLEPRSPGRQSDASPSSPRSPAIKFRDPPQGRSMAEALEDSAKASSADAPASLSVSQEKPKSPTQAVADHVAKIVGVEPGTSAGPLSEEAVQKISLQYVHARSQRQVSEDDQMRMEQVDALLDNRAAIVEAQFNVATQSTNFTPMPSKPYVRARWDHRPSEVRQQLQVVQQQLGEHMQRFDSSLPERSSLTDQEYARLANQLHATQKSSSDKRLKKAIKAVHGLADDLIDAFYEPGSDNDEYYSDFDEEDFSNDQLLQDALVPLKKRPGLAAQMAKLRSAPTIVPLRDQSKQHRPKRVVESDYSDMNSDHIDTDAEDISDIDGGLEQQAQILAAAERLGNLANKQRAANEQEEEEEEEDDDNNQLDELSSNDAARPYEEKSREVDDDERHALAAAQEYKVQEQDDREQGAGLIFNPTVRGETSELVRSTIAAGNIGSREWDYTEEFQRL